MDHKKKLIDMLVKINFENKENILKSIDNLPQDYCILIYNMLTSKSAKEYKKLKQEIKNYKKNIYKKIEILIKNLNKSYLNVCENIYENKDKQDIRKLEQKFNKF